MYVRNMTASEGRALIERLTGMPLLLWCTQRMATRNHQVIISDYSGIAGYAVRYAVAVYDGEGVLLDRFNVPPALSDR